MLLKLPKKPSDNVSAILASWAALKPSATKRASLECGLMFAKSLEYFFNRVLPIHLLYTFERHQYANIIADHKQSLCEIYGMEHLLRLLVVLPDLIAQSSMDPNSFPFIIENLNDFLEFLHYRLSNSSEYKFEYYRPSEEYLKQCAPDHSPTAAENIERKTQPSQDVEMSPTPQLTLTETNAEPTETSEIKNELEMQDVTSE